MPLYPQAGGDLPPEAKQIIEAKLADCKPRENEYYDGSTLSYDLKLGPFHHIYYSTTNNQHQPLDGPELSWFTQGKDILILPPERVIEIAERVVEIRENMKSLGYSFEVLDETSTYETLLAKPVPIEALPDELGAVKDKFGNWKW